MFDIDAGKLLIIGLVALVVIGPKDLPRVLRQVGQMVARIRRMAGEFQGQFMEAMKEADLQDLRAEVAKIKDSATLDVNFDPAHEVRTELTKAIEETPKVKADPDVPAMAPTEAYITPSSGQTEGFSLPPPPEIGPELNLTGAGIAPVAEMVSAGDTAIDAALEAPPAAAEPNADPPSERRKILVQRRRPASRFDGPPGRGPAPNRPRNIRPARRETADS